MSRSDALRVLLPLSAVFVLLLVVVAESIRGNVHAARFTGLFCVMILPLWWLLSKSPGNHTREPHPDLFAPSVFLTLRCLIVYGVFGYLFLKFPTLEEGTFQALDPPDYVHSFFWVVVSLLFFYGGYYLTARAGVLLPRVISRPLESRRSYQPSLGAILVVFGLGLAFKLYLFFNNLLGYLWGFHPDTASVLAYIQWVRVFSDFSWLAIAVLAWWLFRNIRRGEGRGTLGVVLVLLLTVDLLLGLLGGMKNEVIKPFIILGLLYYYTFKKLPKWRHLLLFVLGFMFLIVVNTQYRTLLMQAELETNSLAGLWALFTESLGRVEGVTAAFFDSLYWGLHRNSFVAHFAIVLRDAGAHSLDKIEVYYYLPLLIVVPRIVWPSKPEISPGNEFAVNYLGMPGDTGTSAAITFLGDVYQYFGVAGILIFPLLLGVIFRVVYSLFLREKRPIFLIIYSMLFVQIIMYGYERTFPQIVINLVRRSIIYFVILRFFVFLGGVRRSPGEEPQTSDPRVSTP